MGLAYTLLTTQEHGAEEAHLFHKDREAKGETGLEYSITSVMPPPRVPTHCQECHRLENKAMNAV